MRYGVPADAISVLADSASEIVKFTISIPRESCTNAKAKYSSSVVPPDHSVHFYHCFHTKGVPVLRRFCDGEILVENIPGSFTMRLCLAPPLVRSHCNFVKMFGVTKPKPQNMAACAFHDDVFGCFDL